jgi:N-ethylmaleimide reductase
MANTGITPEMGNSLIDDGLIDLVAFGQPFIANPDLVSRPTNDYALASPDRNTYYMAGAQGYIDYPVVSTSVS